MNKRLYVGQLPYGVDSDQLQEFFSAAGNVESAKVITDRDSGRSKGFGFVEMETEEQAQEAIAQLNGKELMGRTINVSIARPQESRPARDSRPRSGGGGGFGNRR